MEKVFRCKMCTEEFNCRNEFNAQISRQQAPLPDRSKKHFKCNLCGHDASDEWHLIVHTRTHTGERPFKCTVDDCEMAFKAKSALKTHCKSKHSDERPFKCTAQDCEKAFKQKYNLTTHMKHNHRGERRFKCKFPQSCTCTFKTSTNLTAHQKVQSDDRPFACSECNYKANRKDHLKRHRMRHLSARRDFKCSHPECTKSFKSLGGLKLHVSNQHEERNIECDQPGCSRKYANSTALYIHKQHVHSTKSLLCPTLNCIYRTNKPTHLARHTIVHNGGNEKIPCSIEGCHYKLKNSLALERHMHLHKTGLRCPESGCGHFAQTNKAFKHHAKLHNSWERPFKCPLCSKYYPTLYDLQMHYFAHTNEKPFACGHCGYSASFRSHAKTHISSVHANMKFPFIVHLLDERECLDCNVTLPAAEFLLHCEGHVDPAVVEA